MGTPSAGGDACEDRCRWTPDLVGDEALGDVGLSAIVEFDGVVVILRGRLGNGLRYERPSASSMVITRSARANPRKIS